MVVRSNNYRIALIATYPKVADLFIKVTKEQNIESYNIYASFEEAAEAAKQAQGSIDAILSRGGTARYIMEAVDIPVVLVPITPFDVIQIIHGLDKDIKEVALIHYREVIPEMGAIEKMYGIKIRQYTFVNYEDITKAVDDAISRGIMHIIGGQVAVGYAESRNCNGYEISSGEAAVRNAVIEAVNILNEKKKEKENTARIEAMFDSISDGVIATNEDNEIVLINGQARTMLGYGSRRRNEAVDREVKTAYKTVAETGKNELDSLQDHNGKILMRNLRPIKLDDRQIGVLGVYSDVTLIRKAEQKIRKELSGTGLVTKYDFDDIITRNKTMEESKEIAAIYAGTGSSILIQGESGTGKELFAQGIHSASGRSSGPFVAINCAAIGENLLESELFGYEEGAFTGAVKGGKEGLFELAHGGTLFLDEVSEVSMPVQTSLLRVLQEKEIRRVGGKTNIPVDVRIVSATNKNLEKLVAEGKFRNDLYYRLNVLNIPVPPLRERIDDIGLLSRYFADQMDADVPDKIMDRCVEMFENYDWPGNIRELRNIIERLAVVYRYIKEEYTDSQIRRLLGMGTSKRTPGVTMDLDLEGDLKDILHRTESRVIEHFMNATGNDQEAVAERLGISKTTLWRKMKEE